MPARGFLLDKITSRRNAEPLSPLVSARGDFLHASGLDKPFFLRFYYDNGAEKRTHSGCALIYAVKRTTSNTILFNKLIVVFFVVIGFVINAKFRTFGETRLFIV